ncbi:MAG: hypothetical protein WC710_14115 [Gallionella sp.]|jgi:hypothetical protein
MPQETFSLCRLLCIAGLIIIAALIVLFAAGRIWASLVLAKEADGLNVRLVQALIERKRLDEMADRMEGK